MIEIIVCPKILPLWFNNPPPPPPTPNTKMEKNLSDDNWKIEVITFLKRQYYNNGGKI